MSWQADPYLRLTTCGSVRAVDLLICRLSADCSINAMVESFWSTLKHEFYHRHTWSARADVRQGVAGWIEIVCNWRRRHSALDSLRSVELEQQLL